MMRQILILAGKDWSLFWADRRAAWLGFAVPILLASAFGNIFDKPFQPDAAMKLPLLIVCESTDPAVRAFANDALASPRLEAKCVSRQEAERLVADRRPGLAVILPAGFVMPKLTGVRPRLELLHHPLDANECAWAEGALIEVMMQRTLGLAVEPPFRVDRTAVNGARFNSYSHSFCGMTLQYLLFWGMESGLLLLRERRRGVWLRIRTLPVSFAAILLGKALATAAIALLQLASTFAFGYLAFGVTITGSFAGFALLALAISTLAAATGLLVASLGGTEARARSVCILVILAASMIGGLWLPAFLLPTWARDAALALPISWAMHGLESATWQGGDFAAILPSLAAVSGCSLAFLAFAALRLSQSETRRRKGLAAP